MMAALSAALPRRAAAIGGRPLASGCHSRAPLRISSSTRASGPRLAAACNAVSPPPSCRGLAPAESNASAMAIRASAGASEAQACHSGGPILALPSSVGCPSAIRRRTAARSPARAAAASGGSGRPRRRAPHRRAASSRPTCWCHSRRRACAAPRRGPATCRGRAAWLVCANVPWKDERKLGHDSPFPKGPVSARGQERSNDQTEIRRWAWPSPRTGGRLAGRPQITRPKATVQERRRPDAPPGRDAGCGRRRPTSGADRTSRRRRW